MAKEDGLILYELWHFNKVMIEFIPVMFALVWLGLTHMWLPSKWLAVEFFVIYACIYVSKYKPWECVADPNLPYLTLVVLVHVAWCELEDQIAILSTTNYSAIPMSWACLLCHGSGSLRFNALTGQSWVCLVCTALVQEIWGSKGEKEHVVARMSFLQFPSK
jgi:hypothetical protein